MTPPDGSDAVDSLESILVSSKVSVTTVDMNVLYPKLERLIVDKQAEAYQRGYNTGWIKSKRGHDVRKLTAAADQLEELARQMREVAKDESKAKLKKGETTDDL